MHRPTTAGRNGGIPLPQQRQQTNGPGEEKYTARTKEFMRHLRENRWSAARQMFPQLCVYGARSEMVQRTILELLRRMPDLANSQGPCGGMCPGVMVVATAATGTADTATIQNRRTFGCCRALFAAIGSHNDRLTDALLKLESTRVAITHAGTTPAQACLMACHEDDRVTPTITILRRLAARNGQAVTEECFDCIQRSTLSIASQDRLFRVVCALTCWDDDCDGHESPAALPSPMMVRRPRMITVPEDDATKRTDPGLK